MDFEKYSEEYIGILKQYRLPVAVGAVGFVLLIIGLISSFNSKTDAITFKPAENINQTTLDAKKIVVDVSGGVIKPGAYSLPDGSRVQDALILASGLSQNADRDWVSKNLNLAQKLADGTKIYIPKIGEVVASNQTASPAKTNSININSASLSELDKLSGIGPVTAQKIVDNRPYSSINDLISKKVVTEKVFDNLKASISVY